MNTPTTGEIRPKSSQTPATATALAIPQSIDIDALPDCHLLTPEQAGLVLGVTIQTLSAWRCTGRYNLKFLKSGRKVFYRVGDIKELIVRRTNTHTGQNGGVK